MRLAVNATSGVAWCC